jgi:cytochrome c-type biogenesis protein CcmH/NrfG
MFTMFRGLSLVVQLGLVAAGIAGALGSYALWKHSIDQAGYQRHKDETEHADKEKTDAALQARARRHACVAAGGVWDITQGKCDGE